MIPWRLLGLETRNASMNMALDEAILGARIAELVPNTLRLYRWKPSAVSIGRFQKVENEVDSDVCKAFGIDVVRRLSGGGAVYHDEFGEMTYSVVAEVETMGTVDAVQVYSKVYEAMAEALRLMGIKADYSEGNLRNCPNLTVGGRKISGSAQVHRSGVVIQHGTLLLKVDLPRMFKFIRVPWANSDMQVINLAKGKITSLEDELGREVTTEAVTSAIVSGFKKVLNVQLNLGEFTPQEFEHAKKLSVEKYSLQDWNLHGRVCT